jgi:hypothetical protein
MMADQKAIGFTRFVSQKQVSDPYRGGRYPQHQRQCDNPIEQPLAELFHAENCTAPQSISFSKSFGLLRDRSAFGASLGSGAEIIATSGAGTCSRPLCPVAVSPIKHEQGNAKEGDAPVRKLNFHGAVNHHGTITSGHRNLALVIKRKAQTVYERRQSRHRKGIVVVRIENAAAVNGPEQHFPTPGRMIPVKK